jgi:hypothetical protein
VSDRLLFVGWGRDVRGREVQASQVFQEALQFFGGQQQQGNIDGFEVIALEPHGGDLAGFILIRGDSDKIAAMRYGEEFEGITRSATLIVENFGVVAGVTGELLQHQFADFTDRARQMGQS